MFNLIRVKNHQHYRINLRSLSSSITLFAEYLTWLDRFVVFLFFFCVYIQLWNKEDFFVSSDVAAAPLVNVKDSNDVFCILISALRRSIEWVNCYLWNSYIDDQTKFHNCLSVFCAMKLVALALLFQKRFSNRFQNNWLVKKTISKFALKLTATRLKN